MKPISGKQKVGFACLLTGLLALIGWCITSLLHWNSYAIWALPLLFVGSILISWWMELDNK